MSGPEKIQVAKIDVADERKSRKIDHTSKARSGFREVFKERLEHVQKQQKRGSW